MDEWKKIVLSSESQFIIHHVDGCVWLSDILVEQLLIQCTPGHTQDDYGSFLLFGMFLWVSLVQNKL